MCPVYTLIEERYGIRVTRVEQENQGVLIEDAAAEALQAPRDRRGCTSFGPISLAAGASS
ncbi:hypothetical protein [Pseudomonas nicosulfuronedens]